MDVITLRFYFKFINHTTQSTLYGCVPFYLYESSSEILINIVKNKLVVEGMLVEKQKKP